MLKQLAWAAAMSSSGSDPFFSSNRVPKLNDPLNASLCALNDPFPSRSLPSHVSTALLVAMASVPWFDGFGPRNLARLSVRRYASRHGENDQETGRAQEP